MNILAGQPRPMLYTTPSDIARAKINVQRFAWAQAVVKELTEGADRWAAKSDADLRAMVPPPGSKYAYGFSGCPVCNANWPWWGAEGICSFDRPGIVMCPKCKREFPDAQHPDSGDGWKRPSDGKMFYFAGVYNAFAVRQITYALKYLALAYTITGDRKYSRAAASLFDRLADAYPTDVSGSLDYPSNPPSGRQEQPWYQVARRLVLFADYLDLLYESPEFAAPSANWPGSVREHVEESIIRDGGKYCYEQAMTGHMGLTNGQADYVRGALAAGIMLGVKEWIDCAVSGPFRLASFLDNCLDREGHYYETSLGYTDHALAVYVNTAEMLYNYRSNEYPDGINLYTHPKLQRALAAYGVDFDVFGHLPRFGDWLPDFSVVTTDRLFSWFPYIYSELMVARAKDDESRRRWEAHREATAFLGVYAMREKPSVGDWWFWMLFHADPVAEGGTKPRLEQRPVLGGKGAAILRSGRGPTGRAALVRYGPTLNHGHLDTLGLHFYALGRDLTYDLGYSLGSAHVQTSWAKLTASHNLVVVNEQNQMVKPSAGGHAHFYVDAAPVRAFEASDPSCYASESVSEYRRTTALIDLPGGSSYVADIFRVIGGSRHDLMWHFAGEQKSVTGAEMGPIQETGSLAGPDIDWGRKVGPAGDLIGCGDRPPYWNAPPGNGYGFLFNIRRSASLSSACEVIWEVSPQCRSGISLRLLPEPGSELVTARAPGILPEYPQADYVILRRHGSLLASSFASIIEPIDRKSAIKSVRRTDSGSAVLIEVESDAGTDYILTAGKPTLVVFPLSSSQAIRFDGRFGFLRVKDGKLKRAVLVEGTELSLGAHRITSPRAVQVASVKSVDYENVTVTLDKPVITAQPGNCVYLSRQDYSHNSPYRIKDVSPDGSVLSFDADFVLARGQVARSESTQPDLIVSETPLPTAVDFRVRPNGYFRGKLIKNDRTGAATTIVDVVKNQYTLQVTDPRVFSEGDRFTIYDVQPGDVVRIPSIIVR